MQPSNRQYSWETSRIAVDISYWYEVERIDREGRWLVGDTDGYPTFLGASTAFDTYWEKFHTRYLGYPSWENVLRIVRRGSDGSEVVLYRRQW